MAYSGGAPPVQVAGVAKADSPASSHIKVYENIVKSENVHSVGTLDFKEIISFQPDGTTELPTFNYMTIKNDGAQPAEVALVVPAHANGDNMIEDSNVSRNLVFFLMAGEEIRLPRTKMMDFTRDATATTLVGHASDDDCSPSSGNGGKFVVPFTVAGNILQKTGTYTGNASGTTNATNWAAGTVDTNTQVQVSEAIDATETNLTLESTADATNQHPMFKVNDLLWIEDDATSDENELIQVTGVNTDSIDVIRHLNNTNTGGSFADNAKISFACNYKATDTEVKTDSRGNYFCTSFFGLGRNIVQPKGIVPGSVAIKFVESAFNVLGLTNVNSMTSSGLTAGQTYKFKVNPNGAGDKEVTFTVNSVNTKLGTTSSGKGVLAQMQTAMDSTSGLEGTNRVIIHLKNGDIRFTTLKRSTSSSLSINNGSSANLLGAGIFPAVGDIPAYHPGVYTNDVNSNTILYDDGVGGLARGAGGSGLINYETGSISIKGAPPHSNMMISCAHSCSGAGTETSDRVNFLRGVFARSTNKYRDVNVKVEIVTDYSDDTTADYFSGGEHIGLYNQPGETGGPSSGGGGV